MVCWLIGLCALVIGMTLNFFGKAGDWLVLTIISFVFDAAAAVLFIVGIFTW